MVYKSERIEEFTREGESFIYFDLSNFKTNKEYETFTGIAKKIIAKYTKHSVLTITNIKNIWFDTEKKNILADWMKYNEPYVRYGVIIGFHAIKRIMVNAALKQSGRHNMAFIFDKEQAIEWLLEQK